MSIFNKINNKFSEFYDKFVNIETIRNVFFYLGITMVFISISYDYSIIKFKLLTTNALLYSGITLLALKIFLTKESLYNYIKYLICILLAIICDSVIGNSKTALIIILYMISSKKIDRNNFFKYLFLLNYTIILFNLYIYFSNQFLGFNFFDAKIDAGYYLYRNDLVRHGFYFYHPNAFSFYLFWTYILYIYLQWDNLKSKKNYVIIFIVSVLLAGVCFLCTQSRTASIFFLISVPLLLLFKNKKFQESKITKHTLSYFYVIMFNISMFLLFVFKQKNILGVISQKINVLLSNRILLGDLELSKYGLMVFGQSRISFNDFVVDNGYYHILIKYGLLATVFFLCLFVKTSKRLYKTKDYKGLYLIILFCIYNFIEALLVHPQIAIVYVILGMFI